MDRRLILSFCIAILLIAQCSIVNGQPSTWRVDQRRQKALAAAQAAAATSGSAASAAKRDATEGSPRTIPLGSLTLERCMEDNSFDVRNLYCVNLTVPVDYDVPVFQREYMKVAFIVHIASPNKVPGASAVFNVLGGPGTIAHTGMAAKYVNSFSDNMRFGQEMDLVYADQRGIGYSCGMWCVNAYQWLSMVPLDPDNMTAHADALAQYKSKCTLEMQNDPRMTANPCIIGSGLSPAAQRARVIPRLGTKNAGRDWELFRVAAGYKKIWVFGRSYGTAVAQVYAALYPANLAGIIIDSSIDVSSPIYKQDVDLVASRREFLVRTLDLCATKSVECARDLDDFKSSSFWRRFMTNADIVDAALGIDEAWPQTIRMPNIGNAAGTFVDKKILRWHLEYGVLNWEGSPSYRGDIARALIRAARGEKLPLLRMLWGGMGIDVATDTVDVDAVLSGSDEYTMYPMVFGADYSYRYYRRPRGSIGTYDRVMQYLVMGESVMDSAMGSTVMMDAQGAIYNDPSLPVSTAALINATVPSPGWHGNYKILIVGPSIDPFTADTDADHLFSRYMKTGLTGRVILEDGPHVSTAKQIVEYEDAGFRCVNSAVDAFIFGNNATNGQLTTCKLDIPFPAYVPMTPSYGAVSAMDAVQWIAYDAIKVPEFVWYMVTSTGCDRQGTVSWETLPNGQLDQITLNNCQFFDRYVANATGTFDWVSPNLYTVGADITFDMQVKDLMTGRISCFDFTRIAGQTPITTAKRC